MILFLSLFEKERTQRRLSHVHGQMGKKRQKRSCRGREEGEKKKKKKKKEKDLAERIREEVGEETVYLLSEGKV